MCRQGPVIINANVRNFTPKIVDNYTTHVLDPTDFFSRKLTPTSYILAAAPAASKLSHSDVGLQADLIIT